MPAPDKLLLAQRVLSLSASSSSSLSLLSHNKHHNNQVQQDNQLKQQPVINSASGSIVRRRGEIFSANETNGTRANLKEKNYSNNDDDDDDDDDRREEGGQEKDDGKGEDTVTRPVKTGNSASINTNAKTTTTTSNKRSVSSLLLLSELPQQTQQQQQQAIAIAKKVTAPAASKLLLPAAAAAAAATTTTISDNNNTQIDIPSSPPPASPLPLVIKRKRSRLFFNPSDAFCHWWSGVVSLAFLYNFWSLSYRFAFKEIDSTTVTAWFLLDYTADFIYVNDIWVNFRTGHLEDGVLQRDPNKIGLHYRESTLFYLDCLCLLPFDILYLSFGYCSIMRCNKLVKIYKFWSFVDRTERHTNYPNVFRTFALVHYILVIFHWNACLFHMISKHKIIDIETLYKINNNQCDDISCQYLHAFYWSTLALTLIGDLPRPRTRGEYIYVIVELVFGLFLFASVLGHVANIVTNVSAARKEFQAKLDAVKTFMRTRRVSDELQNKVIRWFDYLWISQKSSDEEKSVACLPDRLKAEIAIHVNLDTLKRVDIFQNTEAGFLCELVLRLKPVLFSPGDYVCRKNEVGHEMYIVSRGILEVVTNDGQTVVATFRAGSYFGEIAVLNVGSAGNKRTASVRSVGYSDLFCLSKQDLWDVLKDYPNAEARIRAVAEERLFMLKGNGAGNGRAGAGVGSNQLAGTTTNTAAAAAPVGDKRYSSGNNGISKSKSKSRPSVRQSASCVTSLQQQQQQQQQPHHHHADDSRWHWHKVNGSANGTGQQALLVPQAVPHRRHQICSSSSPCHHKPALFHGGGGGSGGANAYDVEDGDDADADLDENDNDQTLAPKCNFLSCSRSVHRGAHKAGARWPSQTNASQAAAASNKRFELNLNLNHRHHQQQQQHCNHCSMELQHLQPVANRRSFKVDRNQHGHEHQHHHHHHHLQQQQQQQQHYLSPSYNRHLATNFQPAGSYYTSASNFHACANYGAWPSVAGTGTIVDSKSLDCPRHEPDHNEIAHDHHYKCPQSLMASELDGCRSGTASVCSNVGQQQQQRLQATHDGASMDSSATLSGGGGGVSSLIVPYQALPTTPGGTTSTSRRQQRQQQQQQETHSYNDRRLYGRRSSSLVQIDAYCNQKVAGHHGDYNDEEHRHQAAASSQYCATTSHQRESDRAAGTDCRTQQLFDTTIPMVPALGGSNSDSHNNDWASLETTVSLSSLVAPVAAPVVTSDGSAPLSQLLDIQEPAASSHADQSQSIATTGATTTPAAITTASANSLDFEPIEPRRGTGNLRQAAAAAVANHDGQDGTSFKIDMGDK